MLNIPKTPNTLNKIYSSSDINRFRRYLTPKNETSYNRYTKNYFCPFQRYVEHRPNPYRPLSRTNSCKNRFNFPIEKEKFISCYKFMDRRKLYPLITRDDLSKYIKFNTTLFKHKKPCGPCKNINQGNYGQNYYSINKRSFPFVNGNFCGNLVKFTPRINEQNSHSRNNSKKIRYKLIEKMPMDYTEDKYKSVQNVKNIFDKTPKNNMEEMKNEHCEGFQILSRNNSNSYFIRNTKTGFHKTQIFNNLKPFLVDEYKAFAEYN